MIHPGACRFFRPVRPVFSKLFFGMVALRISHPNGSFLRQPLDAVQVSEGFWEAFTADAEYRLRQGE
jgi:hypothetical protein